MSIINNMLKTKYMYNTDIFNCFLKLKYLIFKTYPPQFH